MGVRILANTDGQAALYDSVTGFAFGRIFEEDDDGTTGEELAEAFLTWLAETDGRDARSIHPETLDLLMTAWHLERDLDKEEAEGVQT